MKTYLKVDLIKHCTKQNYTHTHRITHTPTSLQIARMLAPTDTHLHTQTNT